MLVMDSLGLGAFTTVGIQVAFEHTEKPTLFLLVFVGVITGVGGGVIRDLLAGNPPFILVRHISASASLAGALLRAGMLDDPAKLADNSQALLEKLLNK